MTSPTSTPSPGAAFRISSPRTLHKPAGYSHLAEITSGRLIYIAGQVAADATGALVGKNDFRAQATQVFTNLKTAVEAAGGSFASIVKLNCYCVDSVPLGELPAFRAIRDHFVGGGPPPVSTLVFVSRLARPEWLIEIEATAVVD
jgi:enamine deaminase RidA (YjgF/YER057c/UK114 family)